MTTTTELEAPVVSNVPNVPPLVAPAFTVADIEHADIPGKDTYIAPEDILVDETLLVRRHKVTEAKVEEIAKSIVANGQLSAVLVRVHPTERGKYYIVAGGTRVRAVAFANEKLAESMPEGMHLQVAAKVVEMSDLAAFTAGVVENLKRNDMGPVDNANIVGMYKTKFGMSNTDVAKTLGKTQSWVGEHLLILDLPGRIQKKIANREIPYTAVRDLKGMDEEEMDAHVAELESGVSRESGRAKVKAKKRAKAQGEAAEAGKTETQTKNTLTMREWREMLANLGGVGKDAEAAAEKGKDFECKYSERVQTVALVMLKALDGKVGEKALANKIDAA